MIETCVHVFIIIKYTCLMNELFLCHLFISQNTIDGLTALTYHGTQRHRHGLP